MVAVSVSAKGQGQDSGASRPSYSSLPSRRVAGTDKLAYYSNHAGQRIINAETGIPTDYRVGSLDENLFYKIADATQRNSTGDADIYFYESPEHYVRHRFSRIRYNVRSKSGSAKRDQLEKERKNEMLENRDDQLIHWSLVDSRGAPTEDTSRAYMQPRVNPLFSTRWAARRAERVAQLTTVDDE